MNGKGPVDKWRSRILRLLPEVVLGMGLVLGAVLILNPSLSWVQRSGNSTAFLAGSRNVRVLGVILVALLCVAAVARARWWLRQARRWWDDLCPACGGSHLERIPRKWYHRPLGLLLPLHRYLCRECHWKGIRVDTRYL